MRNKLLFIIAAVLFLSSCSKDDLKLENPNEPGLTALTTEVGIQKAALGVYYPMQDQYFIWFTQADHNCMGDATTISAGNFGWRWVNQVSSIKLDDGTLVTPPQGGSQPEMLDQYNSRDQGSDNPVSHEWIPMYGVIGHCNKMLEELPNVKFSGTDAEKEVKLKTYKAWFLWWKGFAFSRVGSIYKQGVIPTKHGELNTSYVANTEILAEAKRNFEEAKTVLATIDDNDALFNVLITSFVPSSFRSGNGGTITPRMFERNINSYLARNILVNKYASELTASDLSEIQALVNNGIKSSDKIFNVKSDPDPDRCFVWNTTWSAVRMLVGWENLSERLVQDFKAGDNRFVRNVTVKEAPVYNPRGRGISYGTRYELIPIESGGDYASMTPGLAEIPMACSYEENQLMLAEVMIRGNDIEGGLGIIDEVRSFQNAGLAPVKGTGLTKDQALEELRRERRIGLFLKGTSFYDARRWGVLRPLSQGGGRTGAVVVTSAAGAVNTNCTIDYNYAEWWNVPENETDFNPVN